MKGSIGQKSFGLILERMLGFYSLYLPIRVYTVYTNVYISIYISVSFTHSVHTTTKAAHILEHAHSFICKYIPQVRRLTEKKKKT